MLSLDRLTGPPPQKLCSVLGVEEGSLFAEAAHSLVLVKILFWQADSIG